MQVRPLTFHEAPALLLYVAAGLAAWVGLAPPPAWTSEGRRASWTRCQGLPAQYGHHLPQGHRRR